MNQNVLLPRFERSKFIELTKNVVYLEDFSFCPNCQKEISPKFEFGIYHSKTSSGSMNDVLQNGHIDCVFECPSCHEAILVRYRINYHVNQYGALNWESFKLDKIFPSPTLKFPFDNSISKISPRFKKIYTQTIQAKVEGKDELVGIGYRKSVEFLLKDYLISKEPNQEDKISKMHLMDCINKLDNERIKDLAKATVWLGNDETHYVRKHENVGIPELEKFLNTLVSYLAFEIIASDASAFINQR